MISLDHQLFPFIYLSVAVNRYGEGISTLTKSNFQVTENGVLQTDYFDVVPPQAGGGVRVVDIVFLMDNSGSMEEEQNAVRDNVIDFVNDLSASEIDFALGLCRFGAFQNSGNPIFEDSGILTSDPEYFKNDVWNRNVIDGGYEAGWDALYEAATSFTFRPGAQKVFILITDETVTNFGGGNIGDYSQNEAIALLQGNSVTVFALLNLSAPYELPDHAIEDYGVIAEQTNGAYYDIFSPFDEILDYISSQVANTYLITYKSSNPAFDGTERHVVVTASYQGDQATCDGTYTPGSAPRIQRTQDTLDLHDQAWAAGTQFTIKAEITDTVEPYVASAILYYRKAGDQTYTPTPMTHSSDIWAGTIPGSAVETPWVGYYITATDGESAVTNPSVDPMVHPHVLAILPNEAPQITHTPPANVPANTPITITAQIVDTTNTLASATLHYRKVGQLIYKCNGEMTNTGGDNYRDTIPSGFVTAAGVEYYILAVDDLGTENSFGTRDDPQQVWISTNKPPEIENLEYFILGNKATFDWKGTDDNTPVDQLEYSCRLIAPGPDGTPDYTKYDWTEWSSAKTQTYEDLLSGHYTFQVHARDSDGAINGRPEAKEFTIGEQTGRVPVIIIPGIMGSYLSDDDVLPWTETPWMLWDPNLIWATAGNLVFSEALSWFLNLPESTRTLLCDPSNDVVSWQAADVYYDLVDYLIVSEGYQGPSVLLYPFSRFEEEGFTNPPLGLNPQPNDNLFVFPYDWRQDIRDIGRNLARAVEWVKEVTHSDRVDIVAHSMGGVVSRYYINNLEGNNDVRKLIFLGVPSFGSPASYVTLKTGAFNVTGTTLSGVVMKEIPLGWLARSFKSTFQLLPTEYWFTDLCPSNNLKYLFKDSYKTAFWWDEAAGELTSWEDTYIKNSDSKLVDGNSRAYLEDARAFHREIGTKLNFDGEFYNFISTGGVTPYQVEKALEWGPGHNWYIHCSDGDGRVPTYSANALEVNSGSPKRCLIYKMGIPHADLPGNKDVLDDIAVILTSDFAKAKREVGSDEDLWNSLLKTAPDYGYIVVDCPVSIELYNAASECIAWYDAEHEVAYGEEGVGFYRLDETRILVLPEAFSGYLKLRGTAVGEAHIEVAQIRDGAIVRRWQVAELPVTNQSVVTMRYDSHSSSTPNLDLDRDGDGTVDQRIVATASNTPYLLDEPLSLAGGAVTVLFEKVVSAGSTTCESAMELDGLIALVTTVSPFYFLSTSAEFTGPVSITIRYEESRVPVGRESDLKLYRISSEDAIEDITQQLDQAANTVTGQTDGFSYFVVGYMSASPETSILSPSAGDTVTGQSCRIHWQATDSDNQASSLSIDLFYSTNGGSTWTSISSNEANDGVYDWNISSLQGGEYWLKLIAEDPEGGTSEATVGPFTISTFEGNIILGPNPVTGAGTAFFYTLPDGTSTAKLMIFNVTGQLLFETQLDTGAMRFPGADTWNPVDRDGVPLANGSYVYVLIADGKVIGQGKMVIQR